MVKVAAMSEKLKKHIHLLKALHDAKPKVRKAIIEAADKEIIDAITECLHNIVVGNISVTKKQRDTLLRYQRLLKDVHNKRVGLKRKKEVLSQRGGFLPAILAPILGIASSIIGGLIS